MTQQKLEDLQNFNQLLLGECVMVKIDRMNNKLTVITCNELQQVTVDAKTVIHNIIEVTSSEMDKIQERQKRS